MLHFVVDVQNVHVDHRNHHNSFVLDPLQPVHQRFDFSPIPELKTKPRRSFFHQNLLKRKLRLVFARIAAAAAVGLFVDFAVVGAVVGRSTGFCC